MHKQGSIRSLIVLLTRLQMMRDGTGWVNDGRDTTAVAYLIINDKPPPPYPRFKRQRTKSRNILYDYIIIIVMAQGWMLFIRWMWMWMMMMMMISRGWDRHEYNLFATLHTETRHNNMYPGISSSGLLSEWP